jgi:hypothetical protein
MMRIANTGGARSKSRSHRRKEIRGRWVAAVMGGVMLASTAVGGSANAYVPTPSPMYAPSSTEVSQINKTNAVLYPKAASLPSGRLVAAFERSIGNPVGQSMPLYKSDDFGTSWQSLGVLKSPAELTAGSSRAAEFAKYTSNWSNPYLYTLPQDVGDLKAGTLLLASLVSGQDEFYTERKAADPNWQPKQDGDRRDTAIALYANTDGTGATWQFVNIIAQGGWSGSYGDAAAISAANTLKQVDPVWEPYLMVYNGTLVAYYTDEVDYTGFNPSTGVLQRDPDWQTAPDTVNQILAHRTWNGVATTAWSNPVADHVGSRTETDSTGTTILGDDRPGMTNVVPTTDGKWILTAEFNVTKISDDPLRFWDKPQVNLGSKGLNTSGSPVQIVIPDPKDPTKWRLASNSSGTGNDVYVNESGRSDGTWVRVHTSVGQGYSRNLTYVPQTGRVVILRGNFGRANPIEFGEVDLGDSTGQYYQLVNRKTGDVLGTANTTQDSDATGKFVVTELAGSVTNTKTQWWHLTPKANGTVTLLNQSGGRALSIWSGATSAGGQLAQWNDDNGADKLWNAINTQDGYVKLQLASNAALYATAGARGSTVTTQAATTDGSQEWKLVLQNGTAAPYRNADSGRCLDAPYSAAGAHLQVWDCVGNANQAITPTATGELRISGSCLGAEANGTAPGTRVILWGCNGSASQKWELRPDGSISNVLSGLVLQAGGTANAGQVTLATQSGTSAQKWRRG